MKFAKRSSALIVIGLYVVALASADQTRALRRYVAGAYPKVVQALRTDDFKFFEEGAVHLVHRHLPGHSGNKKAKTPDFDQIFQMHDPVALPKGEIESLRFDAKGNRRIPTGAPNVPFIRTAQSGKPIGD